MLSLKQFTQYIEQQGLFGQQDHILAAVSGGMDSVIMVHLLKAAGFNFGIAHCNFQLRGDEAIRDQDFCAGLAMQFGVRFHTVNFETHQYASQQKISTQMAARQLRYQWFEEIRLQQGYTVIALAHHQNDAIETILLNLVRGTGIAGLHGILPKNGFLVRPLLFLNREEIKKLIDEHQLDYVEDSSNTSAKYARNKIRLEVVPKLKELNPALEQTFEANLDHFREMELLLQQKMTAVKKELLIEQNNEYHIPLQAVKELVPMRLLLFNLLQPYGFNQTVVDDLISALGKHPGRVFESQGYTLLLDRNKLILAKKKADHHIEPIQIAAEAHSYKFGNYQLTLLHDESALIVEDNPMAASVDSALLVYPLMLRKWQRGDCFFPLGMKGSKKVSDFFINQKVPLTDKENIPLLVNGNGQIIWVAGYRPDDRFKVTHKTKKVTIFELILI